MPGASRAVSGFQAPLCSCRTAWVRSPPAPRGPTLSARTSSPAMDLTGQRHSRLTVPVPTGGKIACWSVEIDELIRTRRTQKAYEPGPVDPATLDALFELARWAPNHHLTNPWRFRVLGPRALAALKDAAGPESARKLDRAPTLVAVTARRTGDPVQDREDEWATAAAAYTVLLGAH